MREEHSTQFFVGSKPPNLVGPNTFDQRSRSLGPPLRDQAQADWQPTDSDGKSFGFQTPPAQEAIHGEPLFALTVGVLAGTLAGVMYRELGNALVSWLGY